MLITVLIVLIVVEHRSAGVVLMNCVDMLTFDDCVDDCVDVLSVDDCISVDDLCCCVDVDVVSW